MNMAQLSALARNASDFGAIYEKLSTQVDRPMEVAVYTWTVIKSQSEYSIPSKIVYETSVAELQRRTNSQGE